MQIGRTKERAALPWGRWLRIGSDSWPAFFCSRLLAYVQGRRAVLLRAGLRGIQTPAPVGVQACTAQQGSGHRVLA